MKDKLTFGYDSEIKKKVEFVLLEAGTKNGLYSYDGITWYAMTLSNDTGYSSVASNGSMFVAITAYDYFAMPKVVADRSEDGVNWVSADLPSGNWNGLVSNGSRFVTVDRGTSLVRPNTNRAAYSDDGINWTLTTLPEMAPWGLVTFNGTRFVAAPYHTSGNSASNYVAYSDDGITWTKALLADTRRSHGITANRKGFVLTTGLINSASNNEVNTASFSPDGINWQVVNLPMLGRWHVAVTNGSRFVTAIYRGTVAGVDSKGMAYSDNGINWNKSTFDLIDYPIVAASPKRFILIGSTTNSAAYSDDGINWQSITLPRIGNWSAAASRELTF